MIEDSELLRRYAEEKSEAAFGELVRRRIGLVYAVALRHTHDAHRAEDVTQAVFSALARKAADLARHPVLLGWLYRSAHFAATDAVRVETRRQAREQEAHTMQHLAHDSPEPDWEKMRSVLDEALNDMDEHDRDAVLLRFYDNQPFAEIGAKLRLSANAARMRVDRALEKLHAALARRGVTSTAAALGVALANQAGVAAPAGLAASVTGAALAGSWVAGAGVAAAGGGLMAFMGTSKIILGGAAAVAVLGIGATVYQTRELKRTEAVAATAVTERAALVAKVHDLETRVVTESKRAQAADDDNAKLLEVIESMQPARRLAAIKPAELEASAPITQELVQARYDRAKELARRGNAAAALKEYLWCYDEGMVQVPSYVGVRSTFLLGEIAKLGAQYPEALAALRARRDAAQARALASAVYTDAALAFASINRELNDLRSTIALYEQLPPDDSRRRVLAGAAYDQLVASQRYADALVGRPYSALTSLFESSTQRSLPANASNPEMIRKAQRNVVVTTTSKSIEVLAGAGELGLARIMADKLIAYDGSAETKAIIQQHATRAGHPELLGLPAGSK